MQCSYLISLCESFLFFINNSSITLIFFFFLHVDESLLCVLSTSIFRILYGRSTCLFKWNIIDLWSVRCNISLLVGSIFLLFMNLYWSGRHFSKGHEIVTNIRSLIFGSWRWLIILDNECSCHNFNIRYHVRNNMLHCVIFNGIAREWEINFIQLSQKSMFHGIK